jgi:hypothetical protein
MEQHLRGAHMDEGWMQPRLYTIPMRAAFPDIPFEWSNI